MRHAMPALESVPCLPVCGKYFLKTSYGTKMDRSLNLMQENIVLKTFNFFSMVELFYSSWGCVGDFCQEIEVIELKFTNDGKLLSSRFYQKLENDPLK